MFSDILKHTDSPLNLSLENVKDMIEISQLGLSSRNVRIFFYRRREAKVLKFFWVQVYHPCDIINKMLLDQVGYISHQLGLLVSYAGYL